MNVLILCCLKYKKKYIYGFPYIFSHWYPSLTTCLFFLGRCIYRLVFKKKKQGWISRDDTEKETEQVADGQHNMHFYIQCTSLLHFDVSLNNTIAHSYLQLLCNHCFQTSRHMTVIVNAVHTTTTTTGQVIFCFNGTCSATVPTVVELHTKVKPGCRSALCFDASNLYQSLISATLLSTAYFLRRLPPPYLFVLIWLVCGKKITSKVQAVTLIMKMGILLIFVSWIALMAKHRLLYIVSTISAESLWNKLHLQEE